MVLELLKAAKQQGITFALDGDKLQVKSSGAKLSDQMRSQIKTHKDELVALLKDMKQSGIGHKRQRIPKRTEQGPCELSFAQQRLWIIDQAESGSVQYNMPSALEVSGEFDPALAEQAMARIIDRHHTLRTVFEQTDEGPLQRVCEDYDFAIKLHDLCDLDEQSQNQKVRELAVEHGTHVFDLANDLMVRVDWLALDNSAGSKRGILLFNMHHIASDGWSMALLSREFVTQYEAIRDGKPDPLPALEIQYIDYAKWQRDTLSGEKFEQQLNYWEDQLAEVPTVHSLPLDFTRPKVKSTQSNTIRGQISADVAGKLDALAKSRDMTPFMIYHGVLALVIARHANNHDVVIGTPVANRMVQELEGIIGFFVNMLVLRTNTNQTSLGAWLDTVRQVNLDAQMNQDVPFVQLVEHINVPRNARFTPLFQIMFTINTNEATVQSIDGLTFNTVEGADAAGKYDLSISAKVTEQGSYFSWLYDTTLFNESSIVQLNQHFERMLELLVNHADKLDAPIDSLQMLTQEQQQFLIHDFNQTQVAPSSDALLPQLLVEQASALPDAIAVQLGESQLSYGELLDKSARLAGFLSDMDQTDGARVGVLLPPSPQLMIALVAILRCGGTYVPLLANQGSERLSLILSDAQIDVVLVNEEFLAQLPLASVDVIMMDDAHSDEHWLSEYQDDFEDVDIAPDDVAYVMYTSGSTGKPKGVEIYHKGLINYLNFAQRAYYDEVEGSLVATSTTFDITVPAMYLPLLAGGVVHMLDAMDPITPLVSQLNAQQQQRYLLRMTPMHVEALLDLMPDEPNLGAHVFVVGGEAFAPQAAQALQQRFINAQIYNHYGPTETVVGCAMYDVTANIETLAGSIPIGRPLDNYVLYVLDEKAQPVPQGAPGELYIGGPGVAKGYVNLDEVNGEKFVTNPFDCSYAPRLYRSGDMVRMDNDGQLNFINRVDDQVKIRGFRIELGEISHQLTGHKDVASSLVMVREDEPGEKQLVAYIVAEGEQDNQGALTERLNKYLHDQLPDYMVPSAYVVLEQWPLSANGKINKKALPAADGRLFGSEYVEPATETEDILAQFWAKLLKLAKQDISSGADFFDIGGNSLLAIRLTTQVNNYFGLESTIRDVFEYSVLSAYGRFIDSHSGVDEAQLADAAALVDGMSDEEVAAMLAQMEQ